MSLVRWGVEGSDVYVFLCRVNEGDPLVWDCCGCSLTPERDFNAPEDRPDLMAAHLREHLSCGEHVPAYVFEALQAEAEARA